MKGTRRKLLDRRAQALNRLSDPDLSEPARAAYRKAADLTSLTLGLQDARASKLGRTRPDRPSPVNPPAPELESAGPNSQPPQASLSGIPNQS